jgi:hypothetical protein
LTGARFFCSPADATSNRIKSQPNQLQRLVFWIDPFHRARTMHTSKRISALPILAHPPAPTSPFATLVQGRRALQVMRATQDAHGSQHTGLLRFSLFSKRRVPSRPSRPERSRHRKKHGRLWTLRGRQANGDGQSYLRQVPWCLNDVRCCAHFGLRADIARCRRSATFRLLQCSAASPRSSSRWNKNRGR